MATPYEYTPLSPDADLIRLLTLFPASDQNEEIVITLQNSTTKAAARQYEALSYVWGPTDNPETVRIVPPSTPSADGDKSRSACNAAPLLVTQNLAVALRHLRRQDIARILWIDAICIDQQNIAERSEQVGNMAQIYSLAARVVIWVGPASPDSDLAMQLVEHLGQALRIDQQTRMIKLASNGEAEPHWADASQPLPYEENELRALKRLFWRPWFERLWVVREVMTSIDAIMICGRQEVAWQSVMVAANCLIIKTTKTFRSDDELASRLHHINDLFDPRFNNTIHSMVRLTRGLKCADDRDRIYASLSFAKDCGNMKPDYSLSTIQAYRDFAALSMSTNKLDFLAECELGNRKLAGPSWIPDWTVKRMTSPIYTFNAGMFAQQRAFESQAEGCIRVSAVPVGTVVDVDVVSFPSSDAIPVTREIVRIVPTEIESLTYKTGCSLIEAFSGTLICSDLKPRVPQTESFCTVQKGTHGLRTILRCGNGLDFEHTLDDRVYLGLVQRCANNRAMVRTDQGYIGLAPWDVKEGDTILAILSCTSFTVVRPAPGNEGRYNVVGEAFLYGLTNGEAVLGPLPEHVHVEHHRHPTIDRYRDGYRDSRTGDVSWIDPRLEALGIPIETDDDGRPFAVFGEALEQAGICLSQVELV